MFPLKIPIERIEEYHTHYLGKTEDDKQFWGYATFVTTKTYEEILKIKGDWKDYRHEYAILHVFDSHGKHQNTKYYFAGSVNQVDYNVLFAKLESMVKELGRIEYQDIVVSPFQTQIDGVIFGLVPNEKYGVINLEPNSTLSFSAPWDGSYCT